MIAAPRAPCTGTIRKFATVFNTRAAIQKSGKGNGRPVPLKCWASTPAILIKKTPGKRIKACSIPAIYLLPLLYGPAFSAAIEQALILLPGVFLISIAGVLAQHFSVTGLPLPLPLV